MRFVFVNPPTSNNDWETCPSLGIAYLMAVLRKNSPIIQQILIDFTVENDAKRKFVKEVLSKPVPEAVFITFMTPQASAAYDLTKLIRVHNGTFTFIIHGGCHATPRPLDSLLVGADVVVSKEGEKTVIDLLPIIKNRAYIELEKQLYSIPGIVFLDDKRNMVTTDSREINTELDLLPFPLWDIFPLKLYSQNLHIQQGLALPLLTSRGCTGNCYFCSSPLMWQRKMRYRSAKSIVDEIEYVKSKYGINCFHLYDDNFLVSRKHVEGFISEMKERAIKINFIFQARIDSVLHFADVLPSLQKVGCVGIELGVENADETVLDKQGKKETRAQIRDAINLIRKNKIKIASCNIMTCNPGETILGHYLQNQFLHELLGLDRIFVGSYFTPFPGSYFGDHVEYLEGKILAENWSEYSVHEVTFIPDSLASQYPLATQTRLDHSDLVILLPTIARANQVAGGGISGVLNLRAPVRLVYQLCNGKQTVEQIVTKTSKSLHWSYKQALQVVIKTIIACSQVGLVADANQPEIKPSLPNWYIKAKQQPSGWYQKNKHNMFYFNDK